MLQLEIRLENDLKDNSPAGYVRQTMIRNFRVPVANIIKGVKDTNKPYKSSRQLANDLIFQPFYGLGNILRAVIEIVIAPFYFLAMMLRLPLKPKGEKLKFFADSVSLALVSISSALFKIVHGAVQIAAWPLTFLRSIYRGLLTAIKGREPMEDNPKFKNLFTQYNEATGDSTKKILADTIAYKVDRALTQNHRTNIDKKALAAAVEESSAVNNPEPLITFFQKVYANQTTPGNTPTDEPKPSPVPF